MLNFASCEKPTTSFFKILEAFHPSSPLDLIFPIPFPPSDPFPLSLPISSHNFNFNPLSLSNLSPSQASPATLQTINWDPNCSLALAKSLILLSLLHATTPILFFSFLFLIFFFLLLKRD